VRDPDAVRKALEGVDAVFHFAALVGVGQSMYEVARYAEANTVGTAVLMEQLGKRRVERLVVASSMSIYGEGLYLGADGKAGPGAERSREQLQARRWELHGPDGEPLRPIPTPEWKPPALPSQYALSKFDQEKMCLMLGRAYGIPAVALRFFNAYGPRQALSNPYTGVLAIFSSRLLNGKPPLINEDGFQRRDFVAVADVARACRMALEREGAAGHVFNIGSGRNHTVLDVASALAKLLGRPGLAPEVTGAYRAGDIRHCFADISLARSLLGYEPGTGFDEGLAGLAAWLEGRQAVDRVAEAREELASRGLSV
jgi:dTDP-L-rhamnose 4-epimerase